MTKKIPLSQGLVALVDDADYDWLMGWKWYAAKNRRNGEYYARRMEQRAEKRKLIFMHRVITNAPDGLEPDHINHNTLDNRRCNLKLGTHLDNMQNVLGRSRTGYKGVRCHRDRKTIKYFAQIVVGKKDIYLGIFPTPEQAAQAYDDASKKYFPNRKCLNFPEVQK